MGPCGQWRRALIESDVQEQGAANEKAGQTHGNDGGPTAGELLREAREQAGMRLPALAANLKVTVGKLEALEANDWDAFPDVVFIRALSSAVCRALKIDAAPVLALLPRAPGQDLRKVSEGINTKVSGGAVPTKSGDFSSSKPFPWMAIVLLLVVATAGVLFYPQLAEQYKKQVASKAEAPRRANTIAGEAGANDSVALGASAEGGDAAANGVSGTGAATTVAAGGATAAVAVPLPTAEPVASSAAEAPILRFKATQDSWIQIKAADGKVMFEKTIKAGSEQDITTPPPLKVVVGNVGGVELLLRGVAFDLKKVTKGSTARFEVN